jgi:GLPGLI family protein
LSTTSNKPDFFMKRNLFCALIMLSLTPAIGQQGEGKITYEQKINVHKRLPPEAEQFKAMVPEFQTNIMELIFTPTTSIYKAAKTQGDELPSTDAGGGGMRSFRFGGADNAVVFRDYEKEILVESRELGPKPYLIEDTLRPLKWKLEGETMQVAGFTCFKATTTVQGFGMGGGMMRMGGGPGGGQGGRGGRDSVGGRQGGSRDSMVARMMNEKQTVVAWYTEEIPSSAGPADYFGLPGLILYLDIDEGTIVFTPTKLEPIGKEVVKAPTKGTKITRQEYFQMMRQQMQNMGGRPGGAGGPTFMIRQ